MKEKIKFLADISSNHCNNLQTAKDLIYSAKESGATYAKFQYWNTDTFINKQAFENLKIGHQKNWSKSVYDTYKKYQLNEDWIPILYDECNKIGIEFLLSCYDINKIDEFDKYVKCWKIGSGDIDYFEIIQKIINTDKNIIFGLGCCSLEDWNNLYNFLNKNNYLKKSIFLQCNTEYTLNPENRKYINLNLLDYFKKHGFRFGLSDHLKNNDIIIGAIVKGATWIERHIRLKEENDSPDNKFSLTPNEFKIMIKKANNIFNCLGDGLFKIEKDEQESRIIQRRGKDKKRPDLEYLKGINKCEYF